MNCSIILLFLLYSIFIHFPSNFLSIQYSTLPHPTYTKFDNGIAHTATRVATAHGGTCKAVKRTRNITNAQDQLTSSLTNPKAETLPNFIQRCLPCKLFTSLEAKSTSSLFLFINDFHDPPNSLMYEFL